MKRKIASGIMLSLLLIGMLALAFNIQPVKASGTIYIRADGSIEGTTDISTVDNVTYTVTNNIFDSIVVERDDIVVDGAGYTVQGTGNGTGIDLSYRNNVTIKNVEITNFDYGIYLPLSSNNTITGNIASKNRLGIRLSSSSDNTITGNIASNNDEGIYLESSSNNTISGNTVSNNTYNFGVYGYYFSDFNNYVDTSNTVDGKPIYYLIGVADAVYDAKTNAGTVYLINCNNITVRDLTLTKNHRGAFFFNTTNSKIENVTASNNYDGIYLRDSSDNVITGNTASSNCYEGISLSFSSNNTITGNTAGSNYWGVGIVLSPLSDNNILTSNTVSNNTTGIIVQWSSNNKVTGNNASDNWSAGIIVRYSSNNTVTGNIASNNSVGIHVYSSSNNTITGNIASNNDEGISFGASYGTSCNDNVFFHNNLIKNTNQVFAYESFNNIWDDGYPSGGNYWSDYEGRYPNATEIDGSGIWDTPYIVDYYNQDNYPLMNPYVPLPGDLNDDRTINILDVIVLAAAFGAEPDDPNWNPDADMNNDDIVNILDAILIAREFGKTG